MLQEKGGTQRERERAKQKGKTLVVPTTSPSPSQTGDAGEEIARLKEQIKNLQERTRG